MDLKNGPQLLRAVSKAAAAGLVASAHDCSEGGLGLAAAEMAFAGGLGLTLDLKSVPGDAGRDDFILFSESASRLLLEVTPENAAAFEKQMAGLPVKRIGRVEEGKTFRVLGLDGKPVVETTVDQLRQAWEGPFKGW